MDSRERTLLALNHQEPDRVPFDMGGTVVTGITSRRIWLCAIIWACPTWSRKSSISSSRLPRSKTM